MEPASVVLWSSSCVCLSLTILVIFCVCCLVQRNKTPIIYYTNLLIATVIQICTMMMMVSKSDDRKISNTSSLVFYCAVMANLYFKVFVHRLPTVGLHQAN
ncbi:uncharacterized protein LOC121813800 isoform X2 [Haplochromis burtoni]|uniref:uncharacterized protein LOC121813800 isoform X2 n=1 Tax=Haplochromis burtoni TaxID=8153 RepID=UPI001C2DA42B|nr:uncharacterized protein LOC121813800 isoform X2 [Haplochromis burtoni]